MARLNHQYRVAVKRLTSVDADIESSHQHEITGVASFKEVLSEVDRSWDNVPWVLLGDSGDHRFETHYLRWYDSRANQSHRAAEWRLYFDGESGIEPDDFLALIVRDDEAAGVVVAAAGSSWESQLAKLLGEPSDSHGLFVNLGLVDVATEFAELARELFSLLGWDEAPEEPESPILESAIEQFGGAFPPTRELSRFVRERTPTDLSDPDQALMDWWTAEEALFLGLERILVEPRIKAGFETVEDFISYSLSVQNRRKSRAGSAFENHLQALFDELDIDCSRGRVTEGNRRPDFLFPGIDHYHDLTFESALLTMLGVKTTCKDRWRQVLTEAERIPEKHLCTLEPAISTNQLSEMTEERLTLVAPSQILSTYDSPPGTVIYSISDFVELVRSRRSSWS